jgi:HEAT repeat protein
MRDEDILYGLDGVDWSALSHAFGPADNVPELLRGLISEDPDARWAAYDELTNTVWHQGTVYSVSAHVVPYLIAMLRSPDTPDKRLPAMLLALLADGSSGLEVHATGDSPTAVRIRAWLEEEGRDVEAEIAQERAWVEDARLAVGEAVPLLLPFLSDDEAEVRYVVALALARYPERAKELLPSLATAMHRETEEYVREAIEQAIAGLAGAGGQ